MIPLRRSVEKRRGVVIAMIGVLLPVFLGMLVLSIDVGTIYNTKADLQNAADAAALAAAGVLGDNKGDEALSVARETAAAIVQRHRSLGIKLAIDPKVDVVFGQVDYDPIKNQFSFAPTEDSPDGVRVTVRRTADSPNGATPLYFAGVFGKSTANITASAASALTGARDLAVTIDLSGSMKYDSFLQYYDKTQINARDIWAALDGPIPSRPYIPGAEDESEYAGDLGPAIGVMDTWGDPISPGSYDPTTDPGLWYIPGSGACTEPDIAASLNARGYSASQINTLMSGSSSQWTYRAAVMVGLAEWNPSGPTDSSVSSGELTWDSYPLFRKDWTWKDYIDWMSGSNNRMFSDHPEFRYRFGVKTFTAFLLDQRDNFTETDLTHTPEEPLQSIKDGVQAMIPMTKPYDQMSLEVFATSAHHELDLSDDRQGVADRLYQMQSNYYDSSTNIGDGLRMATSELSGPRARPEAYKIIVLMSDGASTTGPNPISAAQDAADRGIRVYTVSVGYGADRDLMQRIASIGGGKEFYAAGTPEEYTAQLQEIFRTIGGLGVPALIE